jgi:phospholipase A1/A2
MKSLFVFMTLLAASTCSLAQTLTFQFIAPTQAVIPGAEARVDLVALNRSAGRAAWSPPETLIGRLRVEGRGWAIELRRQAVPSNLSVDAGAFAEATYAFTVPADARGAAVIEIEALGRLRTLLDIGDAAASPPGNIAKVDAPGSVEPPTTAGRRSAISRIQRAFADRFSEHQPVYFIYGADDPVAKFQFSFKYRLFGDNEEGGRPGPVLSGLHFGYTQRSLWDLAGNSSPFYDSSYMPELLFESLAPASDDAGKRVHWLGFQVGAQHESNGRDGLGSRSLNIAYVRPAVMFGRAEGWNIILAPKFFLYVDDLEDNPDLDAYRGYVEFLLALGKNDGAGLVAIARAGSDFENGSVELNFTYPIRFSLGNFASFFLVQYFEGYGESLLNYNERSSTVRFGFSFVR